MQRWGTSFFMRLCFESSSDTGVKQKHHAQTIGALSRSLGGGGVRDTLQTLFHDFYKSPRDLFDFQISIRLLICGFV